MSIGYFEFVPSSLILADNLQFSDLCFTDMLDIDYLVDSPSNRLFLADRLCFHVYSIFFMNLSIYRWFYRFFGFSLLLLSQRYRSDRSSLLMVTNQIQSVCRFIYTRQLICSHVISFLVKLIGPMLLHWLYPSADNVSLCYLYFGVQYLLCLD